MTARRLIPLILIITTLATFAPIAWNDFTLFDDQETIARNPYLNPPSIEGIVHYWHEPAAGLYIPVTYTFWSLLAAISLNPALFHSASIALHVLSVLLVFRILSRMFGTESFAAAIGALVFALHPLQVETVAWASGAKDLLSVLFSMVAIDQALAIGETHVEHSADVEHVDRKKISLHAVIASAALLLAMLAKPSAMVTPVVIAVLGFRRPVKSNRVVALAAVMLLIVVGPAIYARHVQTPWEPIITPLLWRPVVAVDAVSFYLYKLVCPFWLTSFYGRTPSMVVESSAPWFAWVVLVVLVFAVALSRKRRRELVAGGLIFLVALLPVLGFTPFMFQLYSTVADHYMYLPMLGIATIAAAIVSMKPNRSVYAIATVVLLALAVRSSLQTRYWRDSVALFEHAVAYDPNNVQSQSALARSLALAGRVDDAIPHFRFVAEHQANSLEAHKDLALAYEASGNLEAALSEYSRAAELAPTDPTLVVRRDALRQRLATPATTQ